MEDNQDIKAGDMLMCISNEGLSSMGDKRMIYGLTEKSINMCGSTTGWTSRKDFRWRCYVHYPCNEVPQEVIDFAKKTEEVKANNQIALEKQRQFLANRN